MTKTAKVRLFILLVAFAITCVPIAGYAAGAREGSSARLTASDASRVLTLDRQTLKSLTIPGGVAPPARKTQKTREPEQTRTGFGNAFFDNFEGTPHWYVSSQGTQTSNWVITDYRAYSGNRSAYCQNVYYPPGPYEDDVQSWMVRDQAYDLTGASTVYLKYWLWLDTEIGADSLMSLVSTNGVNFWVVEGLTGTTGGWLERNIDVSALVANQPQVYVAFIFETDSSTAYEGAYVDDVALYAPGATTYLSADSVKPSLVNYGGRTYVTGRLTTGGGASVPYRTVILYHGPTSSGPWRSVSTATYNPSAQKYTASMRLVSNRWLRLGFLGDVPYEASQSNALYARSRAYLSRLQAPRYTRRYRWFRMTGYLKPYHRGKTKLYAYKRVGGRWRLVGTGYAKNYRFLSYSRYFAYFAGSPGLYRFRSKHQDSGHALTYSPWCYVRIY